MYAQVLKGIVNNNPQRRQQSCAHLYTKISSVHVVAEEEVLGAGWRAADLEQFHQVVKLAVDVPAHCNKRSYIITLAPTDCSPAGVHSTSRHHKVWRLTVK